MKALPDDEFHNEMAFGQSVQSVMRIEEGRYLRSVSQDLEDGQDVDSIFDPISYNKGYYCPNNNETCYLNCGSC